MVKILKIIDMDGFFRFELFIDSDYIASCGGKKYDVKEPKDVNSFKMVTVINPVCVNTHFFVDEIIEMNYTSSL